MTDADSRRLLRAGENCWAVSTAARFGYAIDGEAYFAALREVLEGARHEIVIVGWDIDSRVELVRDPNSPYFPSPLRKTLETLVNASPDLRVHVLSWDFAMVYVLERELLPAYSFGWQDHERMHFRLDGEHVTGASHHQKLVVVDGCIAFAGGIDLTRSRWDTSAHRPGDERRIDAGGDAYDPFHDVQAVVTGEAAGKLRELARGRWANATGERLPALPNDEPADANIWPSTLEVRAENVRTAIARTWTNPADERMVREVEALYLDSIAAASEWIYIENQYFTSRSVTDALAQRLQDPAGPAVVLVLPSQTSGWLEQATMDVLRNDALSTLLDADHHARLRVFTPVSDELGVTPINVHAKVMVIDGRWTRIGSANLSGRSMGLDTECDLLVDGANGAATRFAADLLGEHMDAAAAQVAQTLSESGLLAAIDTYNGGPRRLERLPIEREAEDPWLEPLARIADLEKPIEESWTDVVDADVANTNADEGQGQQGHQAKRSAGGSNGGSVRFAPRLIAAAAVGLLLFAAYWLLTDGGDTSPGALLDSLRNRTSHPLAPAIAVVAIVAGTLLVAPITWMIAACALLFEPVVGTLTALAGALLGVAATHQIGYRFSGPIASRIPEKVASRIRRLADSADVWSLTGLRLLPIAPFAIVNVAVGVAGVPLRPFLLGSLIALTPGTVLLCFSVDRARAAIEGEPLFDGWVVAAIVLAGLGLIALGVYRNRLRK